MLEKALRGTWRYWLLLGMLVVPILVGALFFIRQLTVGLGTTGLSRDVPWGFYIAQFTFLVGVAASAVMVVLPYYLHDFKAFGKLAIIGECLAISAVIMCMLFIGVDMGQPMRILNVFLHPTPHSMMFWDTVVLFGYLVLNILIAWVTFKAERGGVSPPSWIRPLIFLSVPWAVSIHTVTAWLYSGLAGRPFWLTAVLAPRFLATAFAAGPALLVLLCLVLRKYTTFDPGKQAIQKLGEIVAYAMAANVFFIGMEIFTAAYSGMPHHLEHFEYLYLGLHGKNMLVPWMWASSFLAVISLVLLLVPRFRTREGTLAVAAVAVIASIWIDKGMGMVVTGFIPNPLGTVTEYSPTFSEILITVGVYSIGAFLLTIFYKVASSVREERGLYQQEPAHRA